jgi:glycosyltransferase involved in cell wall biosynthesis
MDVSVVVPTYNRPSLLEKTLGSVADQTYPSWECIVVDDGSTADIQAVIGEFGPDVRYLRQSSAGPSVARNRGLQHARGESVLFLDSDDLLLPEALEVLVGTLERCPEAGVAYGGYYGFTPDGSPGELRDPKLPPGDYSSPWPGQDVQPYGLTASGDVFPELITYDCLLMGTALVRRPLAEESRGFDPALPRMEHWEFFLHLARNGVQFAAAKRPVLLLRMHENSLSSNLQKMLRWRLNIIDRYVPPTPEEEYRKKPSENTASAKGRDALRGRARARAFDYLGCTMVFSGDLEGGLRRVRKALSHRPLPLDTYADITEALCYECISAANPEEKMQSLLGLLGSSRNARSLREYALGRFLQVRAKRTAALALGSEDRRAVLAMTEAVRLAARTGACLTRALMYRPGLIQAYARLITTNLTQ